MGMSKLEDLKWCIEEHGVLKGIWYSDVFSPIYNVFKMPERVYNYLSRFYYYGKVGASQTVDFDASSIDNLIYAHIKRVRKFMDSDDTHLVWNSSGNTGLKRKLYEFEELCRRKCENDGFNDMYYFRKAYDKYGLGKKVEHLIGKDIYYSYEQTSEAKKAKSRARKKDEYIARQRSERYYEMLRKYVPQFWD